LDVLSAWWVLVNLYPMVSVNSGLVSWFIWFLYI
jgi:hypothetical protein